MTSADSRTAAGDLIVARGTVRGETPRPVRDKKRRDPGRRPALRAADFPAYATIASDLEWARMSRRHYEHALRPRLARLAALALHQVSSAWLTAAGLAAVAVAYLIALPWARHR